MKRSTLVGKHMPKLNLPDFDFRVESREGELRIWDEYRKKWILLTPEEWVRQNFLKYIVSVLNYSKALVNVESGLKYNQLSKRHDAVVYNNLGKPWILIECKAANVKLNQAAFAQVTAYNKTIKSKYVVLTNGLKHFCCQQNFETAEVHFLNEIPKCEF